MDAYAHAETPVGDMADCETLHLVSDLQGEVGNFRYVSVPISGGQPAGDHVGIADRLNLWRTKHHDTIS